MASPRSRSTYAFIGLALICAGLLTRWSRFGTYGIVLKYSGAILWGGLVYCAVATVTPGRKPYQLGVAAGLIAVAVEFSQLWHFDALDAFRRTTIGVLLIGRFFSGWDIASYLAGIAAAGLFDAFLLRKPDVR